MLNSDTINGTKVRYIGPETEKWEAGVVFTLECFEIKRHVWKIKLLNVEGWHSPMQFENVNEPIKPAPLTEEQQIMFQEGHETVMGVMMELEHEMLCYSDANAGNVSAWEVREALFAFLERKMAK